MPQSMTVDYSNMYNYASYYRHRLGSSFKDTATTCQCDPESYFMGQDEK